MLSDPGVNKCAVLTTHPIQYQTPWFRALASHPEIDLDVWFCHKATPQEQAAAGFGVEFNWDMPLLEGYRHRFLRNIAAQPGVAGFAGLDTPELTEIIERGRYDAVMVNGWHYKSSWQAMRACWRTKTPVMMRSDSHLNTYRPVLKRAAKWPLYRWFIPKLDACLPVGQWSQEYFLHYGAPAERVFIVPHAVDLNYFQKKSETLENHRDSWRRQWDIEPNAVVFLFVGKFVENKRPLDFARAVAGAAKVNNRIVGLMVGDGPLRSSCEAFVRQSKSPISFAGFLNQSQISRAYLAADALILPSDGETWGLVVNEAMACGLPCFVSDRVGCGPDLIVQDITGAVFPMGQTNKLAELITKYAAEPSRLSAMGQRAKEKVQGSSVDTAVDSLVQAILSTKR
jgi:glycosyltransferase involved in cell wall biosynthesis